MSQAATPPDSTRLPDKTAPDSRFDTAPVVEFQPLGRRAALVPGQTILELAESAGVGLEATCGGQGVCGKCKVRLEAPADPPDAAELKLVGGSAREGYRLACRAHLNGGGRVWVPPESRRQQQVILTTGQAVESELAPALATYDLRVPPASLGGGQSHQERLLRGLEETTDQPRDPWRAPLDLLRELGPALEAQAGRVGVVVADRHRIIDVSPGWGAPCLGLAVDLGTTTVVAFLHDLRDGKPLGVKAEMNPQIVRGGDVISRITHCQENPGGLAELAGLARECIDRLARAACAEAGVAPERIFECVVVGNTAMHHILLGLDPTGLARAPYTPVAARALEVPARELNFHFAPWARVIVLPVCAGFVGADSVAVALATGADRVEQPTLIIDLGTNGEMILATPEAMLCCSAAAGPAFEGGQIRWGMRGAAGAVERVTVDPRTLAPSLSVIGGVAPLGLCGSGLVSLVAALLRVGALSSMGRFQVEIKGPHLRQGEDGVEYLLAPAGASGSGQDLTLSERDISQLQLAKGAIHAGAELMLRQLGLERVERVLLAGAFGNYLDPRDVAAIGLVPLTGGESLEGVGNAAGAGAIMALLSRRQRRRASDLARRIGYLELASHPQFHSAFAGGMRFPAGGVPGGDD
ncbi:MAG: ASKHA domain-containing protein [Desulfarculus sp.]|nr:ASKHA domain-containing protein [Desulfarculus sp.]